MNAARFHLTDRDLLLFADGEHSGRRETAMTGHLRDCWDCRTRAAEMESAIEAFVAARRRLLEGKLQDPKLPTHAASEQEVLRRVRTVPQRSAWPSALSFPRLLPVAVALALVVVLLFVATHHTTLSAAEILQQAAAWESRQAASPGRALHRKFSLVEKRGGAARHRVVEVWRDPHARTKVTLLLDETGQRLAAARLGPVLPAVSEQNAWQFEPAPDTFQSLAGTLDRVDVAQVGNAFRLNAGPVSLALDRGTYRPTGETLRVGQAQFEFTETGAVAVTEVPELEEAGPPPRPVHVVAPVARPVVPPVVSAEQLDAAELLARVKLHELGADIGEPVRIDRREREIEIVGVVDSRVRKDQILAAFRDAAHVRISLLCPEDAGTDALARALETAPAMAETQPPLLESWLERQFPDRGARQAWVRRVLAGANACLQRAHAIADLDARYASGPPAAIAPLLADHRRELRDSWKNLTTDLAPLIPLEEAGADTTGEGVSLVLELRGLVQDLTSLLAEGQDPRDPTSTSVLVEDARMRLQRIRFLTQD